MILERLMFLLYFQGWQKRTLKKVSLNEFLQTLRPLKTGVWVRRWQNLILSIKGTVFFLIITDLGETA